MLNQKIIKIAGAAVLVLAVFIGFGLYFRTPVFNYFLIRGVEHLNNNNLDRAETNLRIARFLNSKDPYPYAWLGKVYVRNIQYGLAEFNLNKALELGIKNKDAYLYSETIYSLGFINDESGRFEDAARFYKEYITLRPNEPLSASLRFGYLNYENLNDPRAAVEELEKLVSLNPADSRPDIDLAATLNVLVKLYLFYGDSQKAITSAREGLQILESQPDTGGYTQVRITILRLNLARALGQNGQPDLAERELAIVRAAGNGIAADCALAEINAVYAPVKNYARAVQIIEALLKNNSLSDIVNSAGFPDRACPSSLAWGYVKTGQLTKAREAVDNYNRVFEGLNQSAAMLRDLNNLEKEL